MLDKLQRWFKGGEPANNTRPRMNAPSWPSVVYAIGDVHGCLTQLNHLQSLIIADSASVEGEKWIVQLGDYVDRGPNSAGVIDKLMSPAPAGFRRICLAGNHEAMMLGYFDDPEPGSRWLEFGGVETLQSYNIDPAQLARALPRDRKAILESHIPAEHIGWMRGLPSLLSLPGTTFVHAGLRPGVALNDQAESDLLWIREPFLSAAKLPVERVVHGHTPTNEPELTPNRICVDTAAFASGILTAVRLTVAGDVKFINSAMPPPAASGSGTA